MKSEHLVGGIRQVVDCLVRHSSHPIAQAVLKDIGSQTGVGVSEIDVGQVEEIPGKGLVACLGGLQIRGGSPRYTRTAGHGVVQNLEASGLTLFTVVIGGKLVAAYGLSDSLRAESAALVHTLQDQGKQVAILSGDLPGPVHQVSDKLGISRRNAHSQCLPADKAAIIGQWQKAGHRVVFIGDGTNDGPALAHAQVSVAVSDGSDLAQSTASVVLLSSDLRRGLVAMLGLSELWRRQVFIALAWACTYNIVAVLFASGATVRVRIEPRWAGLGELASILPVIITAFAGISIRRRQLRRRQMLAQR